LSSGLGFILRGYVYLTEILTIDFKEEDSESAFVPLSAIDGIREVHLPGGVDMKVRVNGLYV